MRIGEGDYSVSGTTISDSEAEAIACALSQISQTEGRRVTLDFSNNKISERGMLTIARSLRSIKSALVVDVETTKGITREVARAIGEAASPSAPLELFFFDCDVGSEGASGLAEGLQGRSAPVELHLGTNWIGDRGATALAETLKTLSSGTRFHINNNRLGCEGAAAFGAVLKSCAPDIHINLSANDSNMGEGVLALAEGLQACTAQHIVLSLMHFNVTRKGCAALGEALKSCPTGTSLVLRYASLTGESAVLLSEGVKHCAEDVTLDVACNDIGDVGAVAMAGALRSCGKGVTLVMESNAIGDAGATAVAAALQETQAACIDLSMNPLTSCGVAALAEGLRWRDTPLTLNLSACHGVGDEGAELMAEALRTCSNGVRVLMSACSVSQKVATEVSESLANTPNVSLEVGAQYDEGY